MNNRAETGPMKFSDDWCGLFIRGDSCFNYSMWLEELLKDPSNVMAIFTAKLLLRELGSTHESSPLKERVFLEKMDKSLVQMVSYYSR